MKKYLMTFAAVLCCAMAATMFVSCGDDDDNGSTDKNKPAGVVVTTTFYVTQDMLDYCTVCATYDDGTGAKTDTITSTSWTKSLTAKLPTTLTFKRTVTLKEGKDMASATTITATRLYTRSYSLVNAAGEGIGQSKSFSGGESVTSRRPATIAQKITQGLFDKTLVLTFDADGNLTEN